MSQPHPLLFLRAAIYIRLSLAYFSEEKKKKYNFLIPNNLSYNFLPSLSPWHGQGAAICHYFGSFVGAHIAEVHVIVPMCIECTCWSVVWSSASHWRCFAPGKLGLGVQVFLPVYCPRQNHLEKSWENSFITMASIAFCSFLFILPISLCQRQGHLFKT